MGWDLAIFTFIFSGPAIGASFYITTPLLKKRYQDKEVYLCFSVQVSFCGIHAGFTLPLWVQFKDERENV